MSGSSSSSDSSDLSAFRKGAEEVARVERNIQREIDKKENDNGKAKKNGHAMQAGARVYPEPSRSAP